MKININVMKNIVILLIVIVIGSVFGLRMLIGISVNEFNEIYLSLWERGLNGTFLIIFIIAIFELSVSKSYAYIENKFDKTMITRIGYKKYYFNTIVRILINAFAYSLIIHVSIIILMNLLHDFDLTFIAKESFQRIYFTKYLYLNISIFILLSSLGSAIFCASLYPFLYFIKNKYLCKFFPLLVFFLSFVISFTLSPVFQPLLTSITGNLEKTKTILCSIIPTSLIEPGCGWYTYAYTDFICGAIIYLLIMFIGFLILKKYRGIYDD